VDAYDEKTDMKSDTSVNVPSIKELTMSFSVFFFFLILSAYGLYCDLHTGILFNTKIG
jgi:hypothetical protein